MTNREQIEQAIISAGAYNGNDTEVLLAEVKKLYHAKYTVVELIVELIDFLTSEELNSKTHKETIKTIADIIIKHGDKLENDEEDNDND